MSEGHGRSFTDPLTNLVVLSAVDVKRQAARIAAKDLPSDAIPTFLHETAHHWCFSSPVGIAHMLLFMKARRAAILSGGRAARGREWDVLDAVSRYEFAQGLMRPLSEGLALFAEHDAVPGDSQSISLPMTLTGTLFAQGVAVRTDPPWSKMPLVLAGGRLSTKHIRRKADLLMQALEYERGGYLPGYLTVKNLWLQNLLRLDAWALLDTDLFLQVLRSHFYDDWSLVAALLDDRQSDVGALEPISRRFQELLISLARGPDRAGAVARFERQGVAGRSTYPLRASKLHLDIYYLGLEEENGEVAVGKERINRLFDELFGRDPRDELEQAVQSLDLMTIGMSQTITLGHADMVARQAGDELIFLDGGKPAFSIPDARVLPDGSTATLGLHFVVGPPVTLSLFLTQNDKVVLERDLGLGKKRPSSLHDHFAGIVRRQRDASSSREIVRKALDNEAVAIAMRHARKEVSRMCREIYVGRALSSVPADRYAQVQKQMVSDGLLPLLGNDVSRLCDLAAATLCAPLHMDLGATQSVHGWGGDPYARIDEINALLKPALGFEVMPRSDRVLLAAAV